MNLPPINTELLIEYLTGLLNTASPTGFTHHAIEYAHNAFQAYAELGLSLTRKGALIATWEGDSADSPRALTAHIDTLGALVKEIKLNGRLKLSRIGGYAWNTVEGEGVTIFTRRGERLRGSLLLTKASTHVYAAQVAETKREDEFMEVRLDVRSMSAEETRACGVSVGDYVAFDPRVEVVNGFVRSRYLDDKACVACLFAAIDALHRAGLRPARKTYFYISNFEEVGHGASGGISPEVTELLVVDMAAIGEGQASDEYHTTICVKDSSTPYHYGFSQRLRQLGDDHQIPYIVDIYPYYGSDGTAFWRAGGDVAIALIGPGVDASHNYERTHIDALVATTQWVMAYLLDGG